MARAFTPSPFALLPGVTVNVDREVIHIPGGMPERDPDWTAVDSNGHGHFTDRGGYPTLKWVVDVEAGFDSDGEEYNEEGHWECPVCAEEIRPGTRTAKDQNLPGIVTVTLTVEDERGFAVYVVSQDQFEELAVAVGATLRSVVAGWSPSEVRYG